MSITCLKHIILPVLYIVFHSSYAGQFELNWTQSVAAALLLTNIIRVRK